MKLNCFLLSEYAAASADGKLTIAGTFDNLDVVTQNDVDLEPRINIPMPPAYLVAVFQGSIADGLQHKIRLRVVDGDGNQIGNTEAFAFAFQINRYGRPLRHNHIVRINGMVLPGPDDYVFMLYVDDNAEALGEFTFTVTHVHNGPNV
jgi:hypothetical protein